MPNVATLNSCQRLHNHSKTGSRIFNGEDLTETSHGNIVSLVDVSESFYGISAPTDILGYIFGLAAEENLAVFPSFDTAATERKRG